MKNSILILVAATLGFASCTQEELPETTLSNKDRMNRLEIKDPLVWNSLVKQSIELDTTDLGLKAGNGNQARKEYPGDGKYYYTLFEDLYPSQGDYDFNDLMLESRLFLEPRKDEISGSINTTLINRGGSLNTRLGLAFYSNDGKKGYVQIPNEQIMINGENLKGEEPFSMDLPKQGTNFELEFLVTKGEVSVKYLWVSWFIIVESGGGKHEIHTSGFPVSKMNKFEIPQRDFLTANNLPWGLELEAERFYIPIEKSLFIDAFPEFQGWAESDGAKNSNWFKNPDFKFIK